MKKLWKRLRGALGVATLWGSIWFAGGFLSLSLFVPAGVILEMAIRFGFIGFMAGGVFGGALAYVYRRREISDIGRGGFILLGAVVSAVFFPGGPLLPALFGATAAGITIRLAKKSPERLNPPDPTDFLPRAFQ